jgi:hypothetical protein
MRPQHEELMQLMYEHLSYHPVSPSNPILSSRQKTVGQNGMRKARTENRDGRGWSRGPCSETPVGELRGSG